MIENSSYKDHGLKEAKYEENIANILDRAVKLFKRTNLNELSEKWERILNTYNSKKRG
jgi:hypothetical protein